MFSTFFSHTHITPPPLSYYAATLWYPKFASPNIHKSTVFVVNKNKIKSFATTMDSLSVSKKKRVWLMMKKLDEALFLWFVQIWSQGLPNPSIKKRNGKLYGESEPPWQQGMVVEVLQHYSGRKLIQLH